MNREKICAALADWPEEKQGIMRLYDEATGRYCALGWLGHKDGLSDEVLSGMEVPDNDPYFDTYAEIAKRYEMTLQEYQRFYEANDNHKSRGYDTPQASVQAHVGCEVSTNG
jgi:hypothetical protein